MDCSVKYNTVYIKVDNFYNQINTNYNLLKSQQITVYEFKSDLDKMESELKSAIFALDKLITPNGLNYQFSVDYLKFSAECGLSALCAFRNIATNPNMTYMNSFEDNIIKGINAKNASMEYVQSIKKQIRE